MVSVVPGARYAAGAFHRFWLGDHYRDLWTTPIRVAILDLRRFAGGLTPLGSHTGSQTTSLRFRGRDGRTYQFRSVFKTPAARLSPELQGTAVAEVVQDGASASHPTGALVAAALLDAVGVLHPRPVLAVMPDDPALGEFRAAFAGRLGIIEERPDEPNDEGRGGFGTAVRVIGPDRLFERIDAGPEDVVDARAFLAARLMDILMGDRDRHRDNWRWALLDASGPVRRWVPVSRDHDEAFVRLDGVLLTLATHHYPQLTSFGPEYGPTVNLNWHAREVDRRFLNGLERAVWDSTVAWIQQRLSDRVIDAAVRQLPAAHYELGGGPLAAALKSRRDALREEADRYYLLLASEIRVHATDEPELLEVDRIDDRFVEVTIGVRRGGRAPYYRRRFDAHETREVRIALRGGADRAVVRGSGDAPITLRIIGGAGRDEFADSSRAGHVRFYDHGDRTAATLGPGSSLDQRAYHEWIGSDLDRYPPREWGSWNRGTPWIRAGPGSGLLVGAAWTRTRYGFRKQPYAYEITLRGGPALGDGWGLVEFVGDLRRENSAARLLVQARASGIDLLRYHGLGNNTNEAGGSRPFVVEMNQIGVQPALALPVGAKGELAIGPYFRYSRTGADESPFFASIRDTLYGAGESGRVGLRARFQWDAADHPLVPTRGSRLELEGEATPPIWDVRESFARLGADARLYVGTDRIAGRPTLALRAGATKLFGNAPFQELSYVGGRDNLRGWSADRFTGDASVYGSAELRVALGGFLLMVPVKTGIFGLVDAGRVYVDGSSPGGWHAGYGGGVWFSLVDADQTFSVSMAASREGTTVNAGVGFGF